MGFPGGWVTILQFWSRARTTHPASSPVLCFQTHSARLRGVRALTTIECLEVRMVGSHPDLRRVVVRQSAPAIIGILCSL